MKTESLWRMSPWTDQGSSEKASPCLFCFSSASQGRDRVQMGVGREREGDAEPEASSRLRAISTEPDAGLKPTNGEIMT